MSCKSRPLLPTAHTRLSSKSVLTGLVSPSLSLSPVLNTTSTICHSSTLPEGVTREQAIAMLQDHHFFLECDLHMIHFEPLAEPEVALTVPDGIEATGESKAYQVTDLVHTLPAGLWDSNVVSTYEITNKADGIFVRIRSPMSIVMDTVWTIKEAQAEGQTEAQTEAEGGSASSSSTGGLELEEAVEINCSRLLMGTVRKLCEGGWREIHAKMLDRLRKEVGAVAGQNGQAPSKAEAGSAEAN
ncbi:uncharacterized protein E0L32_003726 [Thyridium curvatum]|uniref:DUF7053 domain-containing protein n=1 Tax=Thyridium curvatum TaxID=1093900 RepID=A0A507B2C6_9PEZI|nr:uncharacterized protein E0L32_003726 [Thyridium curvatum]TPX16432.1 hypothetical protein E0L32_003726 [Thyridium curvatum]